MAFFFFFYFIILLLPAPSFSLFDLRYFIDCGGSLNFTSDLNRTWLSDRYFSGGSPAVVAEPHRFPHRQEQTLRFFPPPSFGKKNCYSLPVSGGGGRYHLRLFTVYDNYDAKLRPPSFEVSVGHTLAFSWPSPWPDPVPRSGAYSDLIATAPAGPTLDLCFYSVGNDAPVVSSIELFEIDPLSYDSSTTGSDLLLVNYGRLTCGSELFGPGFTIDDDVFGRVWQSDAEFRNPHLKIKAVSSGGRKVLGTEQAHNYFPAKLYEAAVTTVSGSDYLEYILPVDARLDYMLWFHFAEIDAGVNAAGKRVFDVYVNGKNVRRIDIYKAVGGFSAFRWHYVVKNLTGHEMNVKMVPVVGKPIISGLENYAMVPLDLATVPSQVSGMRALKETLKVPDRMGWNGDPCAPSTWDAWEGVTCHRSQDGSALVITQLDLGSQGLKGYISDQISLLTNLVSVNLSSNSLRGTLPTGLGQRSLARLDLSSNQFSGSIPDSLGSSNLKLVLLNNNELDGQVPEKLYSIGVHGGVIDLTGNKGLCGVPTLPACPFSWETGLSTGGKIAIGLACVVVVTLILLVIYIFFLRRGRNDYDFGLPQDLISIAAKRNRYQRQKSLMLLEMETSPNGYTPTL